MKLTPDDRIIIYRRPNALEITIPTKANWPLLAILSLMAIFWWFTGGNNLGTMLVSHDIEPTDWVWALWGIAMLLIILRNLWLVILVKEKILIKDGLLILKKQGSPLAFTKKYELAKIKYFSLDEATHYSFFDRPPITEVGLGTVCFNYGNKTIRFGEGLTEEEGRYILTSLQNNGLIKNKTI